MWYAKTSGSPDISNTPSTTICPPPVFCSDMTVRPVSWCVHSMANSPANSVLGTTGPPSPGPVSSISNRSAVTRMEWAAPASPLIWYEVASP